MTFFATPEKVHELLASFALALMFPTFLVAIGYLWALGAFFNELREKEPEVWAAIGKPSLLSLVLLPFQRFKKYYAFLPTLKERAAGSRGEYKSARRAYAFLKLGLAMMGMLFAVVALMIFWIARYHL